LPSDTLDNSNNVTSVQRLLLVVDLFLLHEKQTLTLNLDVVILLLSGSLAKTATAADTTLVRGFGLSSCVVHGNATTARIGVVLALLLLFLLALLTPNLIYIEQLDGDQITLKSSIPVLATTDEDISIQIGSCDISIASVLLIDAENTGNKLTVAKKSR
jgi:hypothetical protein